MITTSHSFLRASLRLVISTACLWAAATPPSATLAASTPLWQIGRPDRSNAEFALAPGDYKRFNTDPLFVIGQSESARDWPYVHPGPHDAWAGARAHTFVVVFGLKRLAPEGECRLVLDLIDTQQSAPPRLQIQINGRAFDQILPPGSGDASVFGQPQQGRNHQGTVVFPATLLRVGGNEITVTTRSGSWFLYDSLTLETPPDFELAPAGATVLSSIRTPPALVEQPSGRFQPILVNLRHLGPPSDIHVLFEGKPLTSRPTTGGPRAVSGGNQVQQLEFLIPAVTNIQTNTFTVMAGPQAVATESIVLKPVRPLTVFILPHSHTDIGYTENQFQVEEKQVENIFKGIEYARRTAHYPPGAQFKWNIEVLWAADCYLRRLGPEQRAEFLEAVRHGWISFNGMYLNELTGLCRPEELVRLFQYAADLSRTCNVTIDSAMISDVPGYTWGTVTAMAQAGIKYFSTAPNYFDRIGDILVQWENKPFYWVSPSGRDKVLVWIPYRGYALSHLIHALTPAFVDDYQADLERMQYPYDIAYLRWSGHGDNAEPDPNISEFVKDWSSRYAFPRFVIASTSEAFLAFETRYGSQLPSVRGDWTPYWEDGAASSAAETALNRNTSDRLTQAEALWAMIAPKDYPAPAAREAWRSTLLYSEHTWGAFCSVSDPENPMTREQWEIKRSYAVQAAAQTQGLIERALRRAHDPAAPIPAAALDLSQAPAGKDSVEDPSASVDLFNTTSWPRSELVLLPRHLSTAGDRVLDDSDQPVPAQRLKTGELAFLASHVPPLGARRYRIAPGRSVSAGNVKITADTLENDLLFARIDPVTGAIVDLRARHSGNHNYIDSASGHAANDYLFLPGDNLANLQRNGPVKISPLESGPLLASLLIESAAPGCHRLTREIRIAAGLDYLELINTVDKKRAEANPRPGDWSFAQKGGKESVNFAFPFAVPDGTLRLELPLALIQPELDQIPSACKNWFTVGRWADVSNAESGITWVTLDAPLVQVGGITATLLGSQSSPNPWRKKVDPTQRLYSWAMNNHWGTNYRAYQDGPVRFRFLLRPHKKFNPAEASRFATAWSQPLIPHPARGSAPPNPSLFVLSSPDVLVTGLKPSDDGTAWIIRLFGASGHDSQTSLATKNGKPLTLWSSDLSERPLRKIDGPISVPAFALVTLRVDL